MATKTKKSNYVDRHAGTRKVLYLDDALRDGVVAFRRRYGLDWSGAMRQLMREALTARHIKAVEK